MRPHPLARDACATTRRVACRPAPVRDDAEQPGAEAVALLVAVQRQVCADERLLHRVRGIVWVAEQPHRQPGAAFMVPLEEERERVALPIANPVDDRRVGNHHAMLTRQTASWSHLADSRWKSPLWRAGPRWCTVVRTSTPGS